MNIDGVMRFSVQHHGTVRQRGHFITHRIVADQRHHHRIFTFLQRADRHRHFVAQFAVIIDHRSGKILPPHADGNGIPRFGIAACHAAYQRGHAVFNGVDHIVVRDGVDMYRVFREIVDMHAVGVGGNRQVARRIVGGDADMDRRLFQHMTDVVRERRRIHLDAITEGIFPGINHLAVILVAVNLHQHRVARFRIFPAHVSGNRLLRRRQLSKVQGVVGGDIMNIDGVMRLGVQHHGTVRERGHFIPRRIMADQRHHHRIFTFLQRADRHRHFVAQFAVIIDHSSGKILPPHADGNGIPRFGIAACHAAYQRGHAVFNGVDHIVRRHLIDMYAVFREVIDMHAVGVGGNRQIAHRIVGGDRYLHVHITIDFCNVVGKIGSVHRNTVAQRVIAEIDNLPVVLMTVNLQLYRVANLGVFAAHGSGNHLIARIQFSTVQSVIVGHIVDSQHVMCLGIQHHGAVRHSSSFIAWRVMAYQRHLHIVSPLFESCGRHNDFIA